MENNSSFIVYTQERSNFGFGKGKAPAIKDQKYSGYEAALEAEQLIHTI
ncbi:MAG: hypothetical protein H0W50_04080 [Parachlamydiaceae bacterium]|nr:hypothetical protein [Parachlamydiaceae bacterium]